MRIDGISDVVVLLVVIAQTAAILKSGSQAARSVSLWVSPTGTSARGGPQQSVVSVLTAVVGHVPLTCN